MKLRIQLADHGRGVLIRVKVVPKAPRDGIVGELDRALKLTVSAAPEKGAANKAVCKLIAGTLGLPTRQVSIETGQTSPRKTIRITGATVQDVQKALGGA